jgi:hypothetical protein
MRKIRFGPLADGVESVEPRVSRWQNLSGQTDAVLGEAG